MFCQKCGAQHDGTTPLCPNCGADLNAQQAQPAPQYQQAPVAPQPVYVQPVADPAKGLAIASLVLGILSLFIFSIITGTLGIIFGAMAKNKGSRSPMATGGLVCAIIGVAAWLIMVIAGASVLGFMF